MTAKQIYSNIENSIKSKTEITLSVKHGLGETIRETTFQAYILGDDIYQYAFVWGYLPNFGHYYKFALDNIVDANSTTTEYEVREDACYQYSIEEEHFGLIDGFTNIYNQAARLSTQKDKSINV